MSRFVWNKSVTGVAECVADERVSVSAYARAAEWARQEMEPFVPMDTGELSRSAVVSATGQKGVVTYTATHAAACYYGAGRNFGRRMHPLATAFWDREVRK